MVQRRKLTGSELRRNKERTTELIRKVAEGGGVFSWSLKTGVATGNLYQMLRGECRVSDKALGLKK